MKPCLVLPTLYLLQLLNFIVRSVQVFLDGYVVVGVLASLCLDLLEGEVLPLDLLLQLQELVRLLPHTIQLHIVQLRSETLVLLKKKQVENYAIVQQS